MVRLERDLLVHKLALLAGHVAYLREKVPATVAELEGDRDRQLAVLHTVQLVAQIVCDVAVHICASEGGVPPEDYRSAILELGRRGVLSDDLAAKLAPLARMRNVIVHEYERVDLAKVHAACKTDLGDLDRFAAAVATRYGL